MVQSGVLLYYPVMHRVHGREEYENRKLNSGKIRRGIINNLEGGIILR